MPTPTEVTWSKLSLRSRAAIKHIAMREAAGLTRDEIAILLEEHRSELHHLPVPKNRPIGRAWIAAEMKLVREEILESGAASF